MAKKQQKSHREKRKPKANKPKASAQVLPFGGAQGFGGLKSSAGKKAR